jgi:hypothetical protein
MRRGGGIDMDFIGNPYVDLLLGYSSTLFWKPWLRNTIASN